MKIYFGEWKRQKDMLDYFGIDHLPSGVVILAASCEFAKVENEYQWEIAFYNNKYCYYYGWDGDKDIEWGGYLKGYGWPVTSEEFKNRVKEIERIHVCSI